MPEVERVARDDNDLLVALARPLGEFDDARLPGTENVLVARVRINVENVGRLKRVVVALEFELHFDRWKFRRGARLGEI